QAGAGGGGQEQGRWHGSPYEELRKSIFVVQWLRFERAEQSRTDGVARDDRAFAARDDPHAAPRRGDDVVDAIEVVVRGAQDEAEVIADVAGVAGEQARAGAAAEGLHGTVRATEAAA